MLGAGFILGLFGSLHCVGMCGAIALSVPMDMRTRLRLLADALLYNLGRIATYSALGALAGWLGQGFFSSGYQQWLSLELGLLMLLLYFIPASLSGKISRWTGLAYLHTQLKKAFGQLLQRPGKSTLLLMGMLNGLLPCGLVYMATGSAILTGNLPDAMAYMAAFGLGTLPLMLFTSLSGSFISVKIRNKLRKAPGFVVALTAILLIVRGLSLGIPYLSPQLPAPHSQTAGHHDDIFCAVPAKR